MLDCGNCGLELDPRDPEGAYWDDREYRCEDCGATNKVSVDEPDGEDDHGDVYVSSWTCRHGKDDDTTCDLCEIEEAGGVGEVA